METIDFISAFKRQRGNLAGLEYLFGMYFEINKNVDFEDLENYSEIIKEYLDFIVLKNNLNISETNPVFIEYERTKQKIEERQVSAEGFSEYENDVRKLIIYKQSYIVHWGINRGKSIVEILDRNPEYLIWCVVNLHHFSIDSNIFFRIHYYSDDSQYIKAIEINLIKHLIIEKWGTDDDDDFNNFDGDRDDGGSGPESYGYDSWDDMAFNTAFEGDIDAWNHYNQ